MKKNIKQIQQKKASSVKTLLKIASVGKKYQVKGPKDLSSKIDKYLWESEKDRIKNKFKSFKTADEALNFVDKIINAKS